MNNGNSRKQWGGGGEYNSILELLKDPPLDENKPPLATIEKIFRYPSSAEEELTQLSLPQIAYLSEWTTYLLKGGGSLLQTPLEGTYQKNKEQIRKIIELAERMDDQARMNLALKITGSLIRKLPEFSVVQSYVQRGNQEQLLQAYQSYVSTIIKPLFYILHTFKCETKTMEEINRLMAKFSQKVTIRSEDADGKEDIQLAVGLSQYAYEILFICEQIAKALNKPDEPCCPLCKIF